MNPQHNFIASLTKRLVLLILVSVAFIFVVKTYAWEATQSQDASPKVVNGKRIADKESPSERTSFSENGPTGRWSASFIPDLTRNSSNSPVVVVGNSTLMGNKELRNLQLTHVTLKNYSSKKVLALQLKWFVTTKADPTTTLPPPGYTGFFEANIAPGEKQTVECPLVKFSQAIKHLVKNGELDGDFFVQFKAYQVEFDDGTSWNDDWGGPKPGERGERWQGLIEPKQLQNHAALQSCGHSLCSYNTPDAHPILRKLSILSTHLRHRTSLQWKVL